MDRPQTTDSTLARRLTSRVLGVAQSVDVNARISSVSTWDSSDATIVRVTSASLGTAGTALIAALKKACPLATVGLVENYAEGTTEAQVLLPSAEEQRSIATKLALRRGSVQTLAMVGKVGLVLALVAFLCVL